jgi:hypothetical protein
MAALAGGKVKPHCPKSIVNQADIFALRLFKPLSFRSMFSISVIVSFTFALLRINTTVIGTAVTRTSVT